MDILYKTISGNTVNAGTYVVFGGIGLQVSEPVPELEAELGKTLTKETLGFATPVSETTHNHKPLGIRETEPEPPVVPEPAAEETPVEP